MGSNPTKGFDLYNRNSLMFWFKYDLGQKYQAPQVWPLPGIELMTSRSWQHISCHWDAPSLGLDLKTAGYYGMKDK